MKNKNLFIILALVISMISGCTVPPSEVTPPPIEQPEQPVELPVEVPKEIEDMDIKYPTKIALLELEERYGEDDMIFAPIERYHATKIRDLTLIDKNGDETTLYAEYLGKPFIVELMGTWCPVCEKTAEHVNKFNQESDIPYIFISQNDDIESMRYFMENHNTMDIPYYIAKDVDEYTDSFDFPYVPASLFIDAKGIIQTIGVGEIPLNTINSYVDRSFSE
jgi:thiol-disulfide isomerase/thioredoxin